MDSFLLPSLTPTGFRKRFFNWKGLLGALALAGAVCAIPFWLLPSWAAHNEQKWAAQARLLLGRGYYALAYQNAARVLRRDEHNEEASRVVADMQDRQGLPDAVAWRRRVVDANNASSNQLALAATAIKFEAPPSPTAARVLAELPAAATNVVQYHTVMAQLESRGGNPAVAERHYLAALELAPGDEEIEFALALLRLQIRDPAKVAAGEQSLVALSSQTNMAVRALRPLVAVTANRGDYLRALEYSTQILTSESPTLEDRLVHLGVLIQKRDPQREHYLGTLQAQVSANPVFVAQVAAWMTSHGQAREALAWMETLAGSIRAADPVLVTRADAYVAVRDWRGLEQFLLQRPWGTIEFVRQAMLARAHRGLGEQRAAAEYLRRATDLASGMALRLTSLTRMVASWGWEREAADLLWEIFDRYPAETWAADSLLRRHWERNNTEGLRQVFAVQLKRSPKDVYLKNNLAMVMLLLQRDLPTAHRLALEVHQQVPDSAVNASTYAFSLFLQGRHVEAQETLESIGFEALNVPSIAAYYAIVSNALGETNKARQYAELARQARLLPEEKALLEQVRSGF